MAVLPSTVNTASLCKCLWFYRSRVHVRVWGVGVLKGLLWSKNCVLPLYPRVGNTFCESSCFNIYVIGGLSNLTAVFLSSRWR